MLADDRTGAHETAGACADVGCGPVPVVSWSGLEFNVHLTRIARNGDEFGSRVLVIDLATRHLEPFAVAERIHTCQRLVGETDSTSEADSMEIRLAHKLDSTLRGNWATEIVTMQRHRVGPVIVVPAFPVAQRACVGGVVLDHGVPVHEGPTGADARQPLRSSEPAHHLRSVGATDVANLPTIESLRRWLRRRTAGIAVCDAASPEDLAGLGAVWSEHPTATFAGTAASVAAAANALIGKTRQAVVRRPVLPVDPPTLLVCGSLHPAVRRQLSLLKRRIDGTAFASSTDIIATPLADTAPIVAEVAERHATELADSARSAMAKRRYRTVIVLGGDTTAAILGDDSMVIHGTLATGAAWGIRDDIVIVTRPGGFGDDDALHELIVAHDGTMPANFPAAQPER